MRRSAAANQAGVSLFPFLAVLLCTMGALIVLLVVVNRNSRDEAARERLAQKLSTPPIAVAKQSEPIAVPSAIDTTAQAAKVKAAKELTEKIEAVTDQRDELNWRSEHLAEISKKNLTDLQAERARLSSSEELVRELTQQVENLAKTIKNFEQNGQDKSQTTQQITNELRDTEQQLALAKQKLIAAQQAVEKQKPLYSVVPYDGPNRTNRRPIYIECTRDKIILQPEGIILNPLDFVGLVALAIPWLRLFVSCATIWSRMLRILKPLKLNHIHCSLFVLMALWRTTKHAKRWLLGRMKSAIKLLMPIGHWLILIPIRSCNKKQPLP